MRNTEENFAYYMDIFWHNSGENSPYLEYKLCCMENNLKSVQVENTDYNMEKILSSYAQYNVKNCDNILII